MPRQFHTHATVMIADVCQSTWLFDRLGDEKAARLVASALGRARTAAEGRGGRVLRSKGDDLLCIFKRPASALLAAIDIHDAARKPSSDKELQCEMKIGIHSGEFLIEDGQLFGDTVNVAARLSELAKGGQTLLTAEVRHRANGIPEDDFRPLSEISLRGKTKALTLYELLNPRDRDDITQTGEPALFQTASSRLTVRFQSREHVLDYRLARFVLGRSPECDLVLHHPLVSRHHAEIRYQNGTFLLRDYSTNGTVLITRGDSRMLHHAQAAMRGAGSVFLGRTNYNHRLEISWRESGGARVLK